MTHDPNVLNVLSYSLDGRLFKLLADRFSGTLFVSVLCVFYVFEKTGRSSATFFKVMQGCHHVVHVPRPLFVTGSITRALRFTMADDDDYLSDKFLTVAEPQKPRTYSEKRKDALRESLLRNEQNRIKSRRQLELESREEGLSKSLFERAEDDKASGRGPENKALSMMMKMGFQPGQSLGVPTDLEGAATVRDATPQHDDNPPQGTSIVQPEKHERQLVSPLPLNEWSGTCNSPTCASLGPSSLPRPLTLPPFPWSIFSTITMVTDSIRAPSMIGRKGIGLGKRAPSPTELERLAKVAKATEEVDKVSFRDRSRREFEQRRAEARLGPAQQTCATLDERAGKEVINNFIFFWNNMPSLPPFPPLLSFSSHRPLSITRATRGGRKK